MTLNEPKVNRTQIEKLSEMEIENLPRQQNTLVQIEAEKGIYHLAYYLTLCNYFSCRF
jgi:hypothetical protein